jgi:nitrate/TMAO reductase-like tetraheme cytochrome c subunit
MKQSSRVGWSARLASLCVGVGLLTLGPAAFAERPAGQAGVDWGDPKGQECVDCHMTESPGLYWEWNHSQHGQNGVTCLDCHKANEGEIDAFEHEDALISIVVTPKDCSNCHTAEFEEMDGSHHAKAGQILASLDNLLGEVSAAPRP